LRRSARARYGAGELNKCSQYGDIAREVAGPCTAAAGHIVDLERTAMKVRITHAAMGSVVAVIVTLWSANGAVASQPLQPGLWETKVTTELIDSEAAKRSYAALRKRLDSLPPDQRKEAEAAIPKPGVPITESTRVCLTPKQASEGLVLSGVEEDEDCRTLYGERKGNRIAVTLKCEEPPTSGVGEVVVAGPKAWSTSMRTTTRLPNEQPSERLTRTESRWLASDCGSVKPDED
jgi:hypothetical protein